MHQIRDCGLIRITSSTKYHTGTEQVIEAHEIQAYLFGTSHQEERRERSGDEMKEKNDQFSVSYLKLSPIFTLQRDVKKKTYLSASSHAL